jgi:hypothetical protein
MIFQNHIIVFSVYEKSRNDDINDAKGYWLKFCELTSVLSKFRI